MCRRCPLEDDHKLTVRMYRRIRCSASKKKLPDGLLAMLQWLQERYKGLHEELKTVDCSCSIIADIDIDRFSDLPDDDDPIELMRYPFH